MPRGTITTPPPTRPRCTPESRSRTKIAVPGLDALHQILLGWHRSGQSGILTCSALRETYREHLAAGLPDLRFVWLDPPKSVLAERLGHRIGHYMSPNLLDSQLATLEPPALDGKTLHLDGSGGIEDEVAKVLAFLKA